MVFAVKKFRSYLIGSYVTVSTNQVVLSPFFQRRMLSLGFCDGCCFCKSLNVRLRTQRVLKTLLPTTCQRLCAPRVLGPPFLSVFLISSYLWFSLTYTDIVDYIITREGHVVGMGQVDLYPHLQPFFKKVIPIPIRFSKFIPIRIPIWYFGYFRFYSVYANIKI